MTTTASNLTDRQRPQLYNLASDLSETTNLVHEQTGLTKELVAAWDAWEADVNSGFMQ